MKFIPLILIFLYVYLEISVFVIVANSIGVLLALLILVATSALGIYVVKTQGLRNVVQMQRKMQLGESPSHEISKSVLLFLGGFLLLIPGFITAILGTLFLLPPIRTLVTKYFLPRLTAKSRYSYSASSNPVEPHKSENDIVEGTFIRKDDE